MEKNWAPFFLNSPSGHSKSSPKLPSKHIHLIYAFSPLRVLYCELESGSCDMAFSQEGLHEGLKTKHLGNQDSLKGGTNFVPLPLRGIKSSAPVHAWVAFPRTNIDTGCPGSGVYRPILTVMLNIGSQFYLTPRCWLKVFGGSSRSGGRK